MSALPLAPSPSCHTPPLLKPPPPPPLPPSPALAVSPGHKKEPAVRQTKRRRTRDAACQTLTYRELRDNACVPATTFTTRHKTGVSPVSTSIASMSTMSAYGILPGGICSQLPGWWVGREGRGGVCGLVLKYWPDGRGATINNLPTTRCRGAVTDTPVGCVFVCARRKSANSMYGVEASVAMAYFGQIKCDGRVTVPPGLTCDSTYRFMWDVIIVKKGNHARVSERHFLSARYLIVERLTR